MGQALLPIGVVYLLHHSFQKHSWPKITGNLEESERGAWLKLSQEVLTKTWDNSDDDVFNELLAK
jgi:hypothetical protein